MNGVKEKIRLFKLCDPVKFGNVWEHTFHGEDAGDIIALKIYTKSSTLFANGLGIIYIVEKFIQVDRQSSEDILGSLFGWVEISKGDYFNQYEVTENSP